MVAGHHVRREGDRGMSLKQKVIGGRMHWGISDEDGLRFTLLKKGTS